MSDLSEVLPGFLFLSGKRAAFDRELLKKSGITLIVNVTPLRPRHAESGFEYVNFPVEDEAHVDLREHFEPAIEVIDRAREQPSARVLVHCLAGVSRSATIVLAYLMKSEDMKLQDAYDFLKSKRPEVRPNLGFWDQLIKYELELFGTNSVEIETTDDGAMPSAYREYLKAKQQRALEKAIERCTKVNLDFE